MSPLSTYQKRELILLAQQAWRQDPEADATDFDTWRRDHIVNACGKAGLRLATQSDYAPIKAHFLQLLGRDDAAFNVLLRDQDNPKRIAHHKLVQELAAAHLPISYAETICHTQFKCSLADANPSQTWCLFYTIKTRIRSRSRSVNDVNQVNPVP